MDWLDSPPCGGSYLQQQDACGELASFSDFAVCDARLCARDGALPLPPPPPPPPSPTPSSPPSPTHPPSPPPPPPPVAPPPSPPLPPPLPPSPPPPPPSPSPSSPTPLSLSPPPVFIPPPSSPPALPMHSLLQLGSTSLPLPTKPYHRHRPSQNSSGAATHLWSSALLAASCAAFVVFTCLVLRRRFPRRDAAKGAIKANSDEEDADANGGLLTPQRTRWLWAVRLRRWLSRTISPTGAGGSSMADDQRLVARGSESSAARREAVNRAQTLAEMHGLD